MNGAVSHTVFRDLIARIVAALLVAVVAGHAVAPVSAPLERVRGSAFSAATGDVSVLSGTTAIRKADAIAPLKLWLAAAVALLLLIPLAAPVLHRTSGAGRARGPPDPALMTAIFPLGPPAR